MEVVSQLEGMGFSRELAEQAVVSTESSQSSPSLQAALDWLLQLCQTRLTRTHRGLRRVRTGYAHQPPTYCTCRRRRAACPQGPTHGAYWVRTPASGVPLHAA